MTQAEKLEKKLPRGFKSELARRNNCAKSMVSYVFKNNIIDHIIFKDALTMAEEYRREKNSQEDHADKIIEAL